MPIDFATISLTPNTSHTAVCEVLGVKDIVAKSMGTSNAHNVIRATMKALLKQNSPKQISAIRNKKISEIIEKRG